MGWITLDRMPFAGGDWIWASLASGHVFMLAGVTDGPYPTRSRRALVFNPETRSFAEVSESVQQHWFGTANVLSDGRVLVAGNLTASGTVVRSTSSYDPVVDEWSFGPLLNEGRNLHCSSKTTAGEVIVFGGGGADYALASAEVFDESAGEWQLLGAELQAAREGGACVQLANGGVFYAGGLLTPSSASFTAAVDIWQPNTREFKTAAPIPRSLFAAAATELPDGRVMVSGGRYEEDPLGIQSRTFLYDPDSDSWVEGPNHRRGHSAHSLVTLQTGEVLAVGGWTNSFVQSPHLLDADLSEWRNVPSSDLVRYGAVVQMLSDGSVLVAGGCEILSSGSAECTDTAELLVIGD